MSGDKIPPIDPITGQFVRPSDGNRVPSDGNKVYKTETELTKGLLNDEIPHELYVELIKVYHEAYEEAPEYGFVGVGCISFAESMLQYHQDGVERRIRIPTLYDEYSFKQESNDE
jgi:hypothetical protein